MIECQMFVKFLLYEKIMHECWVLIPMNVNTSDKFFETPTISELIKTHLFISQSKIFQHENVLFDNYIPEYLLHRDAAIKCFSSYCKGIVKPTFSYQSFYPLIIRG